jgi:hypothetical protein
MPYKMFLNQIAKNKKLIFLPQTPETFSRLIIEAKMLNVESIINKNIGASYEDWFFNLNGQELINFMKNKKYEIVETIEKVINENSSNNK